MFIFLLKTIAFRHISNIGYKTTFKLYNYIDYIKQGGVYMIKCVAYGSSEKDRFFVQTCCDEEHLGQDCDCKSLGEEFTIDEAVSLAHQTATKLNVPVENWFNNKDIEK